MTHIEAACLDYLHFTFGNSCGAYSSGFRSNGIYSHGLCRYGLKGHRLCAYGHYSGLYSCVHEDTCAACLHIRGLNGRMPAARYFVLGVPGGGGKLGIGGRCAEHRWR